MTGIDSPLSRRDLLRAIGAGGAIAAFQPLGFAHAWVQAVEGSTGLTALDLGWNEKKGVFVQPPLPYSYTALEPVIDRATLRFHYLTHHGGYVRELNRALRDLDRVRTGSIPPERVGELERALAFNGSGHMLHVIYWRSMRPPAEEGESIPAPSGALAEAIDRDFGSVDNCKAQLREAALAVEGGGWSILALEPVSGRLVVVVAERNENLDLAGVRPLLACDVWEHAYYLDYQNRRGEYVDGWLSIVDWAFAGSRMEQA